MIVAAANDALDCPDCGASPGALHEGGCDVERCPVCRRQRISCGCAEDNPLVKAVREPWSGEWPGKAECREIGLYCRDLKRDGTVYDRAKDGFLTHMDGVAFHVPCGPDDEGASEDLNALGSFRAHFPAWRPGDAPTETQAHILAWLREVR